jgi:5-methyltetrahydrofolate--homocysteine methyltransferase
MGPSPWHLLNATKNDGGDHMNLNKLLQQKKPLIFDGALGTELSRRKLSGGIALNLENPGPILDFHREYAALGVDFLTTNTFTANRIYCETHGLSVDFLAANQAAVDLARQATGSGQYVIGDLGPTGRLLEPYGEYSEEQFYSNFYEQAAILSESGADALIVETMTDLREAVCALKACKAASDLPVIVTLSYSTTDKGGRTIMGSTIADAAAELEKIGADAVGANCGELTPLQMAEIAGIYSRHTLLPIIIQPNAGIPRLVGGKTVYEMNPADFAAGIDRCIENGASIVGGCCGTTLEHIKSLF